MALKQLTVPGEIVKKDNELIRSRTNIANKTTGKLLACLISQIHENDVEFKEEYNLEVKQFIEKLQDADGRQIRQIRIACNHLAEAKVWVDKYKQDKKSKKEEFDIIPYFSKVSYSNGIISAKFNPEMKRFLLELKACFTQYNVLDYISLPSIYSQKLFELLKSWEYGNNNKYVEYQLNDLHIYLSTPDSCRNNFKDFRKRILDKATLDINKTSLSFKWEAIKTGRAVTSVKFYFQEKKRKTTMYKKQAKILSQENSTNDDHFTYAWLCAVDKKGICNTQDNSEIICKYCVNHPEILKNAGELEQ